MGRGRLLDSVIAHLPPTRLCIEDALGSEQQCHTYGEAEDDVVPLDVRRVLRIGVVQ